MTERAAASHSLSAELVGQRAKSFDWLTQRDGVLFWVESVPEEGRSIVRSWPAVVDPSVAALGVGSDVHAYGGGPYAVTDSGIWLVNERDGQIWPPGTEDRCTNSPYPHADLAASDGVITCIRERADGDELVVVDPKAGDSVVHRADFLAAPRLRDGRLAWVQWDAAVVPWDSSEVWVANYHFDGLRDAVRVAGGARESATQPQWGPDGALYFMSDRTGWWNLYRWSEGTTEAVVSMAAECAPAPWELGYASYAFLPGGRIALAAQNGPRHRLIVADHKGVTIEVETPFRFIKPYLASHGDRVALVGASPTTPQQIAIVDTTGQAAVQTIQSADLPQQQGPISTPEVFTVASGRTDITVLFYPPCGMDSRQPAPLIVRAHAGPTYNCELRWDGEVQFFTSRGYAVADVDYRGSTGYGRAFRKALDHRWGTLDVDDCCAAATHLIESGRTVPGAAFISGASAGGYTALRAVSKPDSPFAIAVARSAIISPRRWITTAPRIQRPHAAILVHEHADAAADRITRPVLLIHGEDDAVAPIGDAMRLADDLDRRRMLVERVFLPGVGHYLSHPDALARALHAELSAYESVLNAR
jgi:dipeptidyl aminopeptidase/acylaminoacyl peptidase